MSILLNIIQTKTKKNKNTGVWTDIEAYVSSIWYVTEMMMWFSIIYYSKAGHYFSSLHFTSHLRCFDNMILSRTSPKGGLVAKLQTRKLKRTHKLKGAVHLEDWDGVESCVKTGWCQYYQTKWWGLTFGVAFFFNLKFISISCIQNHKSEFAFVLFLLLLKCCFCGIAPNNRFTSLSANCISCHSGTASVDASSPLGFSVFHMLRQKRFRFRQIKRETK